MLMMPGATRLGVKVILLLIYSSTASGMAAAHLLQLSREQKQQLWAWSGRTGRPPRDWNSLYRASVDGWASANFHAKCDNKAPTISVCYTADGYGLYSQYALFAVAHGKLA